MLTQINWPLIILIVVGSALIAYLGDVLGSKYGKQRISLFGLRPRHTSSIITAFTGVLISVAVLSVMSLFSENVRAALVTMQYLRRLLLEHESLLQTTALSLDITRFELETLRDDRNLLQVQRNDLEASIVSLREEFDETRRSLDLMRLGTIAVQANSLLAQTHVPPGASLARVLEILDTLEDAARVSVANQRMQRISPALGAVRLRFDPMEESDIVTRVSNSPERLYLRILAAENIAVGEDVRVRLESGPSHLTYVEGARLHRKIVDPRGQGFGAEEALHVFLRELRIEAIRNGILPDPATNSVGALEGEEFFEAVENLRSVEALTIINAIALQDIYTEGPVRIRIVLE